MKQLKFVVIELFFLLSFCNKGISQSIYPKIGKTLPPFELRDVQNYKSKSISNDQLKGRPYILDFFSIGCSSCFASFSHVDEISKRFGNKLDVIIVGQDSHDIRNVFQDYQSAYSLHLPVTFSKKIFDDFKIYSVPHLIWVGRNGKIVAITSSADLTVANIEKFLRNETFPYWDWSYDAQVNRSRTYNRRRPLLMGNNGGADTGFVFRSIISNWLPTENYEVQGSFRDALNFGLEMPGKKGYQAMGMNLGMLYRLAMTGVESWTVTTKDSLLSNIIPNVVLLTKDSLLFQGNYVTGANLYNYSIILPEHMASSVRFQNILKSELNQYFGYVAKIELRRIPYWNLIIDSTLFSKLKEQNGQRYYRGNFSNISLRNQPVSFLSEILNAKFPEGNPIYEGYGDSSKIDLDANLIFTDFAKTQSALNKIGVHLVRRDTFLNAIVIRDEE